MAEGRRAALSPHVQALLLTAPAACAIIGLNLGPTVHQLLFDSGPTVFHHNLWKLVLLPYAAAFLLVIGRILPPRLHAGGGLSSGDVLVVEFFAGAATLMLVGYILGLAGLLYPALTACLFIGVLYFAIYRDPAIPRRAAQSAMDWFFAREESREQTADRPWRLALIALRLGVAAALLYQTLQLAFALDIRNGDVYQLYASYMGEVRRQHGTQLDPALPRFVDFLVSRGNGVHLFLTSFTDSFFIQSIGTMFLFWCMIITRQIFAHLISFEAGPPLWRRACRLLPDLILLRLLSGAWANPAYHLAKFHTQTSALFLFCLWAASLLFELDGERRRALSRKMTVVFFAIPFSQIAYQAVSTIILAVVTLRAAAEKRNSLLAPIAEFLCAGALGVAISACVDWLYIGIPSLTPFSFFRRLIRPEVFTRWGSEDVLVYTDMIQGIGGKVVFDPVRAMNDAFVPFHVDGVGGQLLVLAVVALTLLIMTRVLLRRVVLSPIALAAVGVFVFSMLAAFTCKPVVYTIILKHMVYLLTAYSLAVFLIGRVTTPSPLPFPSALYVLWTYFFFMTLLAVVANSPSLARLSTLHLTFIERLTKWAVLLFMLRLYVDQPRPWQSLFFPALAALCIIMALINPDFSIIRGDVRVIPAYHDFPRLAKFGMLAMGAWLLLECPRRLWPYALIAPLLALPLAMRLPWGRIKLPSLSPSTPTIGYFTGRQSLIDMNGISSPWVPDLFRRCEQLAKALPDDDSTVVNLNYYVGMGWCVYSADLPRGKIHHQYQSIYTRNFAPLLLSRPEEARALYQKLKIDYFYVEKDTGDFWGAGSSELFNKRNLARYFDVLADTDHFYLLTWRGRGRAPVTPEIARRIDSWRNDPTLTAWTVPRDAAFRQYQAWAASRPRF